MLTDIAGDDASKFCSWAEFADGAPMAPDLSRLSTDELALFEKLLLKIAGEFTGDVAPAFKIEFVNRIESNAMHPKGVTR